MKIDNFIDNFICIDNMPKNQFIIIILKLMNVK